MSDPIRTPQQDGPPGSVPQFWAHAAIFGLGLVLIVTVLARFDRFADVKIVGEKLAHLRQHASDYDTVFIGSSLVYWQISPAAFDAELAARGLRTRSFNLGVVGMAPPESYYLLDQVLASGERNLRHVFLELNSYRLQTRRSGSRRFTYWHTLGNTLDALRGVAARDAAWQWKVLQFGGHVEGLLKKVFLVGQGRVLVETLLSPWLGSSYDASVLGPDGDGWLSAEDQGAQRRGERGLGGSARGEFEEQVEALRDSAAAERPETEVAIGALTGALARIRAAGARPILLVPPRLAAREALLALVRERIEVEVLEFNDPADHPELFDASLRADAQHLNRKGSLLFTREIAARFAERHAR